MTLQLWFYTYCNRGKSCSLPASQQHSQFSPFFQSLFFRYGVEANCNRNAIQVRSFVQDSHVHVIITLVGSFFFFPFSIFCPRVYRTPLLPLHKKPFAFRLHSTKHECICLVKRSHLATLSLPHPFNLCSFVSLKQANCVCYRRNKSFHQFFPTLFWRELGFFNDGDLYILHLTGCS